MLESGTLTLGELLAGSGGTIKTGPFGTILKAAEYVDAGVPIISVGEIGYGRFQITDSTPRASEAMLERLPEYILREGDIVFARKGAVDRSALVGHGEDGWFLGSDGLRVRPARGVEPRYLSYQLQSKPAREWLKQHAAGTTMASLNASILGRVPVIVTTLEKQRAIAEVLGALDDKIAANVRIKSLTDELLSAQLSRALAGEGTTMVALGDIASVNSAVVRPSDGQLRYIDIARVGIGSFEYPELSDWSQAPSRARRRVSAGDTLWSSVRPNRRSHALNLSDDPKLIASTGLAVLSPTEVGFAYLYEVTNRPEFSTYLETVAEGSAYPAVRADRFETAPVRLLSKNKRDHFETVAAPLRRHAHALAMEDRSLAELRDTLLPHLMSGKLRVREAEKQVEAVV